MPLATTSCPQLNDYVNRVESIVDEDISPADCVERIQRANRELLDAGFTLPDALRRIESSAPYTRNLVHQDPKHRFSVIAILWGPWQQTRIHDHLNWGVVSVLEGKVLELNYDLDDGPDSDLIRLSARSAHLYEPGAIRGITPPWHSNLHRMGNPTWKQAITLHTYGDPGTKSRVFDEEAGTQDILDLVFHNQNSTA